MSRTQKLRSLVNERLTAAAVEIFGVFERTIEEYEGEIDRQRKLLDALKPEMRTDSLPPQLLVCEEEVHPEQQERSPSLLQGLEQTDIIELTLCPVSVKCQHDGEKIQSSQLNQTQDPELLQIKEEQEELFQDLEEADGSKMTLHTVTYENNGENTLSSQLNQIQDPEFLQIKDELLQGLEEADCSKMTVLPVKCEDGQENALPFQPLQTQREKNREAYSLPSTSTEQMKTEPDGEDCGVSEPASNLDPAGDLEPTRDGQLLSSDCSGTETDDDWKPQSGLKMLKSKKRQKRPRLSNNKSIKRFKSSMERPRELSRKCGKCFPNEMSLSQQGRTVVGFKQSKSKIGNISAKARAQSYKDCHEDDGKLFCTVCNKVLDHHRKSTLDDHFKSARHLKRKKETPADEVLKRQRTKTAAINAEAFTAQEREKVCLEWVKARTATNTPLSSSDNPTMRCFLRSRVLNGGAIPGSTQLQERYLPAVYGLERKAIKDIIKDKPLSVMFDETSDAEGHCVLNVLVSPQVQDEEGNVRSYMIDTHFLDDCNHSAVAAATIASLNEFGVKPENVVSFVTDDAAYMLKAYNTVLKALYPNALHVTCMAHVMNIVGEAFRDPFSEVNTFMRYFMQVFYMSGARKRRYLSCLSAAGIEANMPPNPCAVRWDLWYRAAAYHADHFHLYKRFFEEEMEVCRCSAPNSLEMLHRMVQDDEMGEVLQLHLNIISEKAKVLLQLFDLSQSNRSVTMKVFDVLEDLKVNFAENKEMTLESCSHLFDQSRLPCSKIKEALATAMQAYKLAEEKLVKCMIGAQTAVDFFRECRVFSPSSIGFFSQEKDSISHIPGYDNIPQEEISLYFTKFGPAAISASAFGFVDADLFWDSMQDQLPNLSKLAKMYKDCPIHSGDVERSDDIYKIIVSAQRRSLSEANIRALLFLYYNLQRQCIAPDDDSSDDPFDGE